MAKMRTLAKGDVLPASFLAALQEFVSTLQSNLNVQIASASSITQAAGTGSLQVALGIGGLWRFNTAAVTAAMPGGSLAGSYDVYGVASGNFVSDSPLPDTDTTDYTWGLRIVTSATTPTGNHNSRAIVAYRKIATLDYDGATIVRVVPIGSTAGASSSGTAAIFTQAIGDGTALAFNVDHNLGTRDVIVRVRQNASPWAEVTTDVEYFSINRVIIRTDFAITASALTVTVLGLKSN